MSDLFDQARSPRRDDEPYDHAVDEHALDEHGVDEHALDEHDHPVHEEPAHEHEHEWDGYDDHEVLAPEPAHEGRRPQREERLRKRRRQVRRRRTFVVLLVCLALFGGAVFAAWTWLRPLVDGFGAPSDYAGPGTGSVEVVINPGDTGRAIGQSLEEAGVVLTAGAFVDAARVEPRSGSLQPGTYELKREMAAAEALALLLDPASKISVTVQVREGLWVPEIYSAISQETGFSVEQLEEAAKDPAVSLPPEAGGDPQGYYFPATYSFDPDVTPVQVLASMVARHVQAMDEAGVPAAERRDVLIRASIVQNEGTLPEDMAKIATVIQNRLDKNMPLGMDSTVNFALQKRGLSLSKSDLAVDSPYNTRVNTGLPPGPIGAPGQAAIQAVETPTPGDWLYFVTVNPDTGETKFTADAAEFEQFVAEYRRWQAENGG